MNERLKVGDTVQVTAAYITKNPNSKYLGKIGKITDDDNSGIPFRVSFPDAQDYDWFRVGQLELLTPAPDCDLQSIKYTIMELMDGKIFYTQNGTKVHRDKGILKFGKAPLDLEKLVGVDLSRKDNSKPPFDIDKVKGTHCQVWDTVAGKDSDIYRLIVGYLPTEDFKFRTNEGSGWKHAVPVK